MWRDAIRIGILVPLVAAMGCNNDKDNAPADANAQTPPATEVTPAPEATPPAAEPAAPAPVAAAPVKKATPPAPKPKPPTVTTLTVPAGTSIVASLVTPLTTETAKDGDTFTATTQAAVMVDGKTAVPSGAEIHGVLQGVQGSGRVSGRAAMTLSFVSVVAHGETHAISADPIMLQAESEKKGDLAKVGIGAAAGAIIGGITGGKKGAAIGAGVGAGAGTAVVLATKGDEVVLEPGQAINVHTTAPITVAVAGKY